MQQPSMPPVPATAQDLSRLSDGHWDRVIAAEPSQGRAWMTAVARLGSARAQVILGQWLLDGHGGPREAAQAFGCFLQAAAQQHPIGMNMVGRCHENGWGTPVDFFAAANWYRQAARTGLDAAMYNYANLLQSGKGVALDHAAAVALYRDAADQGHAKSMTKIGRYYEDGLVLEKDADAAFFCYQQAAQGGDFRGMFCYAGLLAAQGQVEQALQWLHKVPETATPGFMAEAGRLLLDSPHEAVRAVGHDMLGRVTHAG
ncbi:MAG: sel1 repeat family protein [Ramlibacter sp.]|nr:sel1 repeat family protein [Ramlibacter sp.]